MEIGIFTRQFLRFIPKQGGLTRQVLPVETHESRFPFSIHKTESVNTKAFHCPVATRDTSVGHRPEDVMQGFRLQRHIIPETVMCTGALWDFVMWLGFNGMDEVREFVGILNKEHRGIIAD